MTNSLWPRHDADSGPVGPLSADLSMFRVTLDKQELQAIDCTLMGVREKGVVTLEMLPLTDDKGIVSVTLTENMTLDDLLKSIKLPEGAEVVIVNGTYVKPDYRLQDGDRVTVFPFMSGG